MTVSSLVCTGPFDFFYVCCIKERFICLKPLICDAAEACVGKGLFKKRISIHGKGKCGLMIRPECRLTVIVRETTPEEEAEIAKLKVHNFRKLTKRERRLNPHKLIETTPIWNRRGTKANHRSSVGAISLVLLFTNGYKNG